MKVTLSYIDDYSLTKEEVIRRAEQNYGKDIEIGIAPTSNNPLDLIYLGIQQLITHKQLSLYFDYSDDNLYSKKLEELKYETMLILQKELSDVLRDNELKVT